MTEQISIPLSEFSLFVFVLSSPTFFLALFLAVFALRKRDRSWMFCGVWVALGIVANPLITIVLWLGVGHVAARLPTGGAAAFIPALIAALLTTAPAFLLRRKKLPALHSRNES